MSDPFKTVTGVSLAGVITLFALYGKGFWESAVAAWGFLLQITQTAPLGLASFFAALALATLGELALERWVPNTLNQHGRRAAIEIGALLIAVTVSWLQLHSRNGLLFGILAGLLAPLLARMMLAVASFTAAKFAGATHATSD